MDWIPPCVLLENLYEKDKILKLASVLKQNMRFSYIGVQLASSRVLGANDMQYLNQPLVTDTQKLDYLIYHILLLDYVDNAARLRKFNEVLKRKNLLMVLNMVTIERA